MFDPLDRMTALTDWSSNTVTFGYDADSNPTTTTFPAVTGEIDTTTYNRVGTVTRGSLGGG